MHRKCGKVVSALLIRIAGTKNKLWRLGGVAKTNTRDRRARLIALNLPADKTDKTRLQ